MSRSLALGLVVALALAGCSSGPEKRTVSSGSSADSHADGSLGLFELDDAAHKFAAKLKAATLPADAGTKPLVRVAVTNASADGSVNEGVLRDKITEALVADGRFAVLGDAQVEARFPVEATVRKILADTSTTWVVTVVLSDKKGGPALVFVACEYRLSKG